MLSSRIKALVPRALLHACAIGATLLAFDGLCIAFGLFPPHPQLGDRALGWRSAGATGAITIGRCYDFDSDKRIAFALNEDGIRTESPRAAIHSDTSSLKLAVSGDSHTELCTENRNLHGGVLERELAQAGITAKALTYAAGKYSPLQAYLAFRDTLTPYRPQVFVLNFYTGNDFYDMLRVDDRPHFEPFETGYRIAAPLWYSLDDPSGDHRSRVLFAARQLANLTQVRPMYLRVAELRRLAVAQGAGTASVFWYVRDLWRAREPKVPYPDAFTSQMLNQVLFFEHFPSAQQESLRRVRALMAMARRENPDVLLVMSALPSYLLTSEAPVDPLLIRVFDRLPMSYREGVQQEDSLYRQLRVMADEEGWLFVDNLAALREYRGSSRLFSSYHYHPEPVAAAIVGKAQADAIAGALRPQAHAQPGGNNTAGPIM